MIPEQELRSYIETIRNRTTNTMEQWNLMIDAERVLLELGTNDQRHVQWTTPPDLNGGWEPPLG